MRRPAHASGAALAAAVLALCAAGCQRAPSPREAPALRGADPVAARVGGESLHASDVQRAAFAQGSLRAGEPIDPAAQLFRQTLDALVAQRLLAYEAMRLHLDREPPIRARLDAVRDKVLGDAVLDRVVGRSVDAKAVQALYDEQQKSAKPLEDEVHARQIVLPTAPAADEAKRQLAAGADFAKLAAQRSRDAATRFEGGDLGWFAPSILPLGYAQAMAAAKTGEVVGPFPTAQGFVVARVDERRPQPPLSLEAARPQIVRFLTYDEIRSLLARLRAADKVEVLMGPPPPALPIPASGAPRP